MGTAQLHGIRAAGDDVFHLVAELMSGCGMRNGEAPAVSINNFVANNAYRITEQVNQTTKTYAPSSTARSATTATSRSRHGSSTPSSGTRTRTAPLTATCSAARET